MPSLQEALRAAQLVSETKAATAEGQRRERFANEEKQRERHALLRGGRDEEQQRRQDAFLRNAGRETTQASSRVGTTIAWRDFILWAWNEPDMRTLFAAKTGIEIQAVTSPINAAIDAATSANNSVASKFIEWATREHWGIEHAPVAYRKMLTAKGKKA